MVSHYLKLYFTMQLRWMTTNYKLRKASFSFIFVNYQIFTMRWILSFFWDIIFYTQPHFLYILQTMYRVQSKTNFLIMDRVKNWKWEQNTPFLTWTKQPLIFSNSWAPIHCTAGDWNHIIVFIYSWPSWHSNFKCLDLGLPFFLFFLFFWL